MVLTVPAPTDEELKQGQADYIASLLTQDKSITIDICVDGFPVTLIRAAAKLSGRLYETMGMVQGQADCPIDSKRPRCACWVAVRGSGIHQGVMTSGDTYAEAFARALRIGHEIAATLKKRNP